MNKRQILKQIIAALTQSLAVLEKAARASHEEATHESSRAESKYDTRGLEAAYLAGGQTRQAKEILDAISLYDSLALKKFASDVLTSFSSGWAQSTFSIPSPPPQNPSPPATAHRAASAE